jgi:hypothetical protein
MESRPNYARGRARAFSPVFIVGHCSPHIQTRAMLQPLVERDPAHRPNAESSAEGRLCLRLCRLRGRDERPGTSSRLQSSRCSLEESRTYGVARECFLGNSEDQLAVKAGPIYPSVGAAVAVSSAAHAQALSQVVRLWQPFKRGSLPSLSLLTLLAALCSPEICGL